MKFTTVDYRITSTPIQQDRESSKVVWFLDAVQTCDILPGVHLDNITSGTKEHCEKIKATLVKS
jgi:hypothetical protein